MNEMTESNRKGWDGLAEAHYKNYHIDRLLSGEPLLDDLVRTEVGDVAGKSLVHLLCHIGSDTLSWALLGAKVTGVDISPVALTCARKLADRMGVEAEFIESDVMELMTKTSAKYDIVFSSLGVLCWLPDIDVYARTVRHLLKDDGLFYLHEFHPFVNAIMDDAGSMGGDAVQGDYFRKQVWKFDDMGDYVDLNIKIPHSSYEWNWTLGEVVTACCNAGLRIEFLREYPRYTYGGCDCYFAVPDKVEPFPCVFSLKASVG